MLGGRAAPLLTVLLLAAACTGDGGATGAGSPSAPTAAAPPVVSASPTTSAVASSSSGIVLGSADPSVCTGSTEPTVVSVTIEDFAFVPAMVEADADEVITFTNTGFESHNATLDSGACRTPTLETGGGASLVFSATGTFDFHCTVHGWMTGAIVVD